MRLPDPPERYDQNTERRRNLELEREDAKNVKNDRDGEYDGQTPIANGSLPRIILRSADGTRYVLTVTNAGALGTATAP